VCARLGDARNMRTGRMHLQPAGGLPVRLQVLQCDFRGVHDLWQDMAAHERRTLRRRLPHGLRSRSIRVLLTLPQHMWHGRLHRLGQHSLQELRSDRPQRVSMAEAVCEQVP
jgi:hypothetical protein